MSVHQFKPKTGDTSEKITINLGVIDLGQIDLLVQEGFYSNRTDLIRTAIRNQLSTHAEVVRETVARKTFVLGLQHSSRGDLEACVEQHRGRRLGVLQPQVGQQHVFACADTAGNSLANGACAYDDGDATGVLHEYLE